MQTIMTKTTHVDVFRSAVWTQRRN